MAIGHSAGGAGTNETAIAAIALRELINELALRVQELERSEEPTHSSLAEALHSIWLFTSVAELASMSMGYAMRQAGVVRERSMVTTYATILLCIASSAVMSFAVSFNLAYPNEDRTPTHLLMLDTNVANHGLRKHVAFHIMSQMLVCSIVSGAMAERTCMVGASIFHIYVVVIQALAVRFTWGGGFLSCLETPFLDSAGSGVVSLVGGTIALVGALIVGPRHGRWAKENQDKFVPHSLSLTTTGTMLIWCGWYGYIFESQQAESPATLMNLTSLSAANTTVGVAVAGMTSVAICMVASKEHCINMVKLCNSIIGGLVATSGSNDMVALRHSAVIGAASAILVCCSDRLLRRLYVDDVSHATSIHGVCGAWGVVATGLFHHSDGLIVSGSGALLLSQVSGLLFLATGAAMLGAVGLMALDCFGILRVSGFVEMQGLDDTLGFQGYVRTTQEMGLLRQANRLLEKCGHRAGDALGTMMAMRRIISRPFTPDASHKKKIGEVSDVLEQLDANDLTDDNSTPCAHFMHLVYDRSDGDEVARDFARIVEGVLRDKYGIQPSPGGKTFVNLHDYSSEDAHEHMGAVEGAQNVVVLLTKDIYAQPWCIAEIVHASCLMKKLLCIHVDFHEPEEDPRVFKFPQDLARIEAQWQEVVDETGEEVPMMRMKTTRRSLSKSRRTWPSATSLEAVVSTISSVRSSRQKSSYSSQEDLDRTLNTSMTSWASNGDEQSSPNSQRQQQGLKLPLYGSHDTMRSSSRLSAAESEDGLQHCEASTWTLDTSPAMLSRQLYESTPRGLWEITPKNGVEDRRSLAGVSTQSGFFARQRLASVRQEDVVSVLSASWELDPQDVGEAPEENVSKRISVLSASLTYEGPSPDSPAAATEAVGEGKCHGVDDNLRGALSVMDAQWTKEYEEKLVAL